MRPKVPEEYLVYLRTMQEMEGAEHLRLRRLVAPAFTPRRIAWFRSRIERIVDGLLDDLPADGRPVDLLAHFARPLPMPIEVICELVGIPEADRVQWRKYGAAVASGSGEKLAEAIPGIMEGAKQAIARRRQEPGPDLISDLIRVQEDDGDRLGDAELVTLVWQLVLAGQTPINLIVNAVAALFTHPDQLAALRADPAPLPRAVEELTRWCGPQLLAIPRFPSEDVEVGGVPIPIGTLLRRFPGLSLAAPPARLPDPGTWRLASLPIAL